MKKKKPTAPPRRGALDLDTVRDLAGIAVQFDLAEVEADPSGHVRVRRMAESASAMAGVPAGMRHGAPGGLSLMPAASAEPAEPTGPVVSSPFVGTFYRSSSPDAAAFAEIGQSVRKGQVVCIVEAMKLMNEIESESDGKVVEILAKNGDHVEYGQALFRLAKS